MIMLLICTAAFGAAAQSKDEQTVAAGVEKLRLAMISGNKKDLLSVLSPDLSYGHSGGGIESHDSFVNAITTKKSDFVNIALTEQSITVTGDVAIVRHILIADTNDGGKPANIHLGIVLIWKKSKSEWKLIARRAFHVAVK